jgi:hypothetical protein
MTARERLTNSQIVLMRYLAQRGAQLRAITLAKWQRVVALPLWRRGLIEMWWRTVPDNSMQGPYFGLTIVGARLAFEFAYPAPRGRTGAEKTS